MYIFSKNTLKTLNFGVFEEKIKWTEEFCFFSPKQSIFLSKVTLIEPSVLFISSILSAQNILLHLPDKSCENIGSHGSNLRYQGIIQEKMKIWVVGGQIEDRNKPIVKSRKVAVFSLKTKKWIFHKRTKRYHLNAGGFISKNHIWIFS